MSINTWLGICELFILCEIIFLENGSDKKAQS